MGITPYLFFDGHCDEAIEFYRQTFNAELLHLMRFSENPDPGMNSPENSEKVMHASLRIGGTEIMMSDGNCTGQTQFKGISLAYSVASVEEAERSFSVLSDGGQIQMPLSKTFFLPRFGAVADRFGVSWMIITEG